VSERAIIKKLNPVSAVLKNTWKPDKYKEIKDFSREAGITIATSKNK
jgi:hypothetical protein